MSEDTKPYVTIARGDEQHGYKYVNVYGPASPRQGTPLDPLLAHEKPEYDSEADAKKAIEERLKVEAGGPPAKDATTAEEKPAEEEKPARSGFSLRRKKEDE